MECDNGFLQVGLEDGDVLDARVSTLLAFLT